jgi:tricorn protease-like protein
MKEWYIRTFKIISIEEALKRNLVFHGNVHGDEIKQLNCRSIWQDSKKRTYRVKELG